MPDEPTDRNVYIVGAGFSRDAGAPLIQDFLDRAREFLDDPQSSLNGSDRQHFQKVFEFKRRVAQAAEKVDIDLDNIEQLFGLLEMSERLGIGSAEDVRPSMRVLIARTLELATATKQRLPEVMVRFPESRYEGLQKLGLFGHQYGHDKGAVKASASIYHYFAALLTGLFDDPRRRTNRYDSVITLNYDLVLESSLAATGYQPDYYIGVTPAEGQRTYCVPVLKLHGSINWGVCERCNRVTARTEFAKQASSRGGLSCPHCGKDSAHLLIIPPSWDKSEHKDVTKSVWSKAAKELTSATRICVIGYSMPETDVFYKYLLTLALAENPRLYRFIVVDLKPNAGRESVGEGGARPLRDRYADLLQKGFQRRRFLFYDTGLYDFLAGPARTELGRGEAAFKVDDGSADGQRLR
jgi:hypothetical protein